MHINEMTRKDFEALPLKEWNKEIIFDSMVVLPGRAKDIHESGYRRMDFVAIKDGKPICRLSGYSDVIHIDGIGGYGYNWPNKYGSCLNMVPPTCWSIDCLPKSGLLRLWPASAIMTCGPTLSSFEIYALPKAATE